MLRRRSESVKDSHGRLSHLPVFLLASEKGRGKGRTYWKDTQEQKGGLCGCSLLEMLASLARCRGRAGKGLCREHICGDRKRVVLCYGLCLNVLPKSPKVTGGAFLKVAVSSVCKAGTDSWCNASFKGKD